MRSRIAEAEPEQYTKHTQARTVEKAIEYSHKHAQYLPNVDNKKLEKEALMKAEYIYIDEKNRIFFIYDTGQIVGYDEGKSTTWIRSELIRQGKPLYHGHPISKRRAESYLKKSIRRSELFKE